MNPLLDPQLSDLETTPRNLICLGGGLEAVPIIERAKALGCTVIVVDIDGRCPARLISDVFVQESCYHSAGAIETLNEISTKQEMTYAGVLCCAIDAPIACAEIAAAFGLPGLSVAAATLGQNKIEQAQMLKRFDVLCPNFFEAESKITVEAATLVNKPFVIKPLDSRGGRGVVRLLPSVDPAFAYEIARSNSPTGRVMLEEWLDGPQFSTESIVQDGKVLFTAVGLRNYDRLDEFAPYCIEDGFDEPYGNTPLQDEISELIEQAARALNWYQSGSGTVKGDLVLHNTRFYIIELACRLSGGFFATHGHPLSYGADLIGVAIESALGLPVNTKAHNRHIAGVPFNTCVSQRYVFAAKEDIGKTVKGLPFKEFSQNGLFETFNLHPGQVIEAVTSHPQRWGQALATGWTSADARLKAEQAVSAMKASVVLEDV